MYRSQTEEEESLMRKITLPAAIRQKQRKDELHEETRAQQHEFIDCLHPEQGQSG